MNKIEIAEKLIKLRKQKALSQDQLSHKSGVALRTIQRIEAAKVTPHLQTLSLIAAALEIDVDKLTVSDQPLIDRSKRNWLLLFHLAPIIGSIFPTGSLLLPFACWLYKRQDDTDFDSHGRSIINFQISMLILFGIALVLIFIFTPAAIFLIFGSIILNVVFVLLNSWKVSQGKPFFYPFSIRFFRRKAMPLYATSLTFLLFTGSPDLKAQQIKKIDGSVISTDSLRNKILFLMDKAKVKGLELAVFNQNKVVYKEAFGIGNDTGVKLHPSMSIYGASLSKTVFAVLVLKLVEEGLLDLDKPLQGYLPKPIYEYPQKTKWQDNYNDLRTDTLYKRITARMCLDHTSGFPNWRWGNSNHKLSVAFVPGSRYSYSGEGLVYLQTVIEKITGKSLEQLMKEKIFTPFKMENSAYTWRPNFEADYALGYNHEGKAYEKDKDNEARSASTLETTLDDYTKFIETILKGRALKKHSQKEMFNPQVRLRSISQFGPLSQKDTSANDGISLSYGLGWGLLKSPYGWGAFKEGHGDGFQHYCIIFPEIGTGIIIMTNSDNGESIFKDLLEIAIADKYTPWKWQNYIPYNQGPYQE
jgi:D-alanyl-D-alanine-carboxypeptidase/D-alanyl-D-alanine-endopeptidase